MDKKQLWEKIQRDFPDMAEFIKQLRKHGITIDTPTVKRWPNVKLGSNKMR